MRLYSEEWIAAFNGAVATLDPDPAVSFRMRQVVNGGPDGTVRIIFSAHEGHLVLERETGHPQTDDLPDVQVTVSLDYDEALALARGEADPARLLAAGKVKVRGDLSVLVRGQALLAAAAARLEPLSERTTS